MNKKAENVNATKKLENVVVGGYTVAITVERTTDNNIEVTATIGDTARSGVLTLAPLHNRTNEQLQSDLNDFIKRLATECAGHAQSAALLDKVFAVLSPPHK
jgi:hypothetical protein